MPAIQVATPMGFVGIMLLGLGVFLLLSGLNIIKIEKVTVQPGRATWIFGMVFAAAGAVLLLKAEPAAEQAANPVPPVAMTATIPATLTLSPGGETSAPGTSTPVPAPTSSTLQSRLAEGRNWGLVLHDSFDRNDASWNLWSVDNENSQQVTEIRDGLFGWTMRLKKPDLSYREDAPLSEFSDFYYSLKVRSGGTPAAEEGTGYQADWGLFFRRQDSAYYAFLLNDDQEYAAELYNGSKWIALINWTPSAFIYPGGVNELSVVADGPDLVFFINGAFVGTVKDDTLASGKVGLFAGLRPVLDTDTRFEFDDFELRKKPGS